MYSIKKCLVLSVLSAYLTLVTSSNILSVCPLPSKSHDILGSSLLKQLAKIGHNVTYISAYHHKDFKNFHHIHLMEALKYKEESNMQSYMQGNTSNFQMLGQLTLIGNLGKIFYDNEGVKNLLTSSAEFDLFISFMGIDASIILAERYDMPMIIFAAVGGFPYHNKLTGNPAPLSYVPNMLIPYSDEMNFLQRTINTVISYTAFPLMELVTFSMINSIITERFPGYPTVEDIITERTELILVNSHISTESPRPYVPNMIQIGGYHLQEPEALSENLKEVLDEGEFIYVSFGTNVKVKDLPESVLGVFKKVLGSLPLKVIFKYEDDTIVNKPDNFYLGKWFPQPSVLAHPNAKLFISHGGYGGCTESLFYGVPMVCIPFFADQPKNCADAERNGHAVTVTLDQLNENTLLDALNKVLYDDKIKEAVKFKSELYRDQPMNPMDKAVYWIEHVIKHKGAKHLKVKGAKLPWYQYHLIDVFLFIGTVLLIVFSSIYYSCRFVCRKLCSSKNKVKTN